MASPTWPTTLPQVPLAQGLSARLRDTRVSFEPERGPALHRRGFSAPLKEYDVSFTLTLAQLAGLEAFIEDDLGGGALPFGFRDPGTGTIHLWQIVPGSLTDERRVGPSLFTVGMKLLRRGVPWYAAYSPAGAVIAPSYLADFTAGRYAVAGDPVAQAAALEATTGSVTISSGALVCPGDGSDEYATIGLTLPAEGTALITATVTSLASVQRLAAGVDSTETLFGISGSGDLVANDGATNFVIGTPSAGVEFTAALSWSGTSYAAALNGSPVTGTYAAGAFTGVTPLGLGSESDGGSPFTGGLARIAIYSQVLTAAQAAQVTGGA